MFSITYQHHLKPGKTLQDFNNWMKRYWSVQQSWGAVQFKLHNTKDSHNTVTCEYSVENVKKWICHAIGDHRAKWLKELEEISELRSITIRPDLGN